MREFGIAAYRLFLRTRKVSGSTEERGKVGKHARNKFINETDVKVGGVSSGTQGRFLTFGAKRSRATTPLPPWRSPRDAAQRHAPHADTWGRRPCSGSWFCLVLRL